MALEWRSMFMFMKAESWNEAGIHARRPRPACFNGTTPISVSSNHDSGFLVGELVDRVRSDAHVDLSRHQRQARRLNIVAL